MIGLIIELIVLGILVIILINLVIEEKRIKLASLQNGRLTGAWNGTERRAHIRIDTILTIRYSLNHNKKNSVGKNISNGGVLIQLGEKLSEETNLRIDIHLPNEEKPVAAKGQVVWVKELSEMDESGKRVFDTGVKFTWMDPKDRTRLDKHIKGLL